MFSTPFLPLVAPSFPSFLFSLSLSSPFHLLSKVVDLLPHHRLLSFSRLAAYSHFLSIPRLYFLPLFFVPSLSSVSSSSSSSSSPSSPSSFSLSLSPSFSIHLFVLVVREKQPPSTEGIIGFGRLSACFCLFFLSLQCNKRTAPTVVRLSLERSN